MKKPIKGTKFAYKDNVKRIIIDVERYRDCDYVCYYTDKTFDDGDNFFEKDSPVYDEIIKIINEPENL